MLIVLIAGGFNLYLHNGGIDGILDDELKGRDYFEDFAGGDFLHCFNNLS
jgi:hypothetical protein